MHEAVIEEWQPAADGSAILTEELNQLAGLLHAVVHNGASVNFILPFKLDNARSFWVTKVLPSARTGNRRVLLARDKTGIIGTVQLNLDTPPNQHHRADVAKLLVDPRAQRQGLGRRLMQEIEVLARLEKRTLLTLDTRTGDKGESLYLSLGYIPIGAIPSYSKNPASDDLEAATFFYKLLI